MVGNRSVSGKILGTGVAIAETLGFVPSRIDLNVGVDREFTFTSDMLPGSLVVRNMRILVAGAVALGTPRVLTGTTSAKVPRKTQSAHIFIGAPGTVIESAAAETALTATTHDVGIKKWAFFIKQIVTAGTVTYVKGTDYGSYAAAMLPANRPAKTSATLNSIVGAFVIPGGQTAIFDATTDDLPSGTVYWPTGGIYTGGITLKGVEAADTYKGFEIGVDGNVNILHEPIYYKAYRD